MPRQSSSVDRLDLALLHALQIAPRASWTRIGRAIGIDPVTAARRWTRLTAEGYGWMTAYCSPPMVPTIPYALVAVRCAANRALPLARDLVDDPHAVTVSHTAGSADLLVAIWASDLPSLSRYLEARLAELDKNVAIATKIVADGGHWRLRALRADQQQSLATRLPTAAKSTPSLSGFDRALLIALSTAGRATSTELATLTGASLSTVRRHLARQDIRRSITVRCDVARTAAGFPVEVTLFAAVPPNQLTTATARLAGLPQTRLCAVTLGNANLALTFWLRTADELPLLEAKIARRVPDVHIIERLFTLRHFKFMGRILEDDGRAQRAVPFDIWQDPTTGQTEGVLR